MTLSDENIAAFQTLYLKKFGVEITKAEAMEKGIRLVRLMEIVLKHRAKKSEAETMPESINN